MNYLKKYGIKRYTVIDNKTGNKFNYTKFEWNLAWVIVFFMGIFLGFSIAFNYF